MKASDNLTYHELASLLNNSSEGAFEVIYNRYWHKSLAIAGRRLNDIENAEEVVQNIFFTCGSAEKLLFLQLALKTILLLP